MTERKLGIIAGGGTIPQMLIDYCRAQKRDYFVLAIEGNAIPIILRMIFRIYGYASARPEPVLSVLPKKKCKMW